MSARGYPTINNPNASINNVNNEIKWGKFDGIVGHKTPNLVEFMSVDLIQSI